MFNKLINHDREIILLKKYIESLRKELIQCTCPIEKRDLVYNIEEENLELEILEKRLKEVTEDV